MASDAIAADGEGASPDLSVCILCRLLGDSMSRRDYHRDVQQVLNVHDIEIVIAEC
jgi:hypothetical protein